MFSPENLTYQISLDDSSHFENVCEFYINFDLLAKFSQKIEKIISRLNNFSNN